MGREGLKIQKRGGPFRLWGEKKKGGVQTPLNYPQVFGRAPI